MCWKGEKGKCMHIMYSENKNGVPMYDAPKQNTRYIGYYIDDSSKKSKNPKDYEWERLEDCKMGQCDIGY